MLLTCLAPSSPHIHKGRWTEHEDAVLKYSVLEFSNIPDGEGGVQPVPWNRIAERIPNRTGIQCQARWTEALDPTVRKGKWSEDEDTLLRAGVERFGRCWIRIAETVPGRTQRQCRTRWMQIKYKEEKLLHGSIKKKQQQQQQQRHSTASASSAAAAAAAAAAVAGNLVDDGHSSASCTSTEADDGQHSLDMTPAAGLVASQQVAPRAQLTPSNQAPFVVDDFDFDLDAFEEAATFDHDKTIDYTQFMPSANMTRYAP